MFVIPRLRACFCSDQYTLFGAGILFLMSLLLGTRLSINFTANLQDGVSNILARNVKPEEMHPLPL
jgi:hypothetical protein